METLARGLSDIAAMGGEPRFCLLSLALAPWTDSRWIDAFYRGLLRLASREGAPLIGGDLGHAGKLACDIVVCGASRVGPLSAATAPAPAMPSTYPASWAIRLGLATGRGAAWKRHTRPSPVYPRPLLRTRVPATAAMDISDGLSLDLQRLCLASGVAAEIIAPPAFPGATLDQALHGGEDYELLFTVRPGRRLPPSPVPLTRIGTVRKGPSRRRLLEDPRFRRAVTIISESHDQHCPDPHLCYRLDSLRPTVPAGGTAEARADRRSLVPEHHPKTRRDESRRRNPVSVRQVRRSRRDRHAKPSPSKTACYPSRGPTLPAIEAASDLDDLYGRMLLRNRQYGWARDFFQKNVIRWKTWKPQTPDTERRWKQAAAAVAECDRDLAK